MMIRQSTRHEEVMQNREKRVELGEWSEHPEVENIGMGRACRSMAHIACTRSTETIRMQNKEEIRVVVVECD
jgi:hypothetical protein